MKTILTKIASILAFIIGGMAVFAGAQVLLGNDPGYYVINWLANLQLHDRNSDRFYYLHLYLYKQPICPACSHWNI